MRGWLRRLRSATGAATVLRMLRMLRGRDEKAAACDLHRNGRLVNPS